MVASKSSDATRSAMKVPKNPLANWMPLVAKTSRPIRAPTGLVDGILFPFGYRRYSSCAREDRPFSAAPDLRCRDKLVKLLHATLGGRPSAPHLFATQSISISA